MKIKINKRVLLPFFLFYSIILFAHNPYSSDSLNTLSFESYKDKLHLSGLFTNHMVVQRNKPIVVWGSTSPKNKVNVKLEKTRKIVTADSKGYWIAKFRPLPAGGPYSMEISTKDTTITISDILSGDVWFCSGQSNMEFQLRYAQDSEKDIQNSTNPNIRLLRIPHNVSLVEGNQNFGKTYWLECNPTSAARFSAVGYYFGRKIQEEINIPIGLIASSWGGSGVQSWMSKNAVSKFPVFLSEIEEIYSGTIALPDLKKRLNVETERRLAAIREKKEPNTKPYTPYALQHVASITYNGMVAPFVNFPLKGVIWYQAEHNVSRAHQYESLFRALIDDWRKQWKNRKMPFYFVQLPNYGLVRNVPYTSQWAETRESQEKVLDVKNSGMVVTIDVGDCNDLHPKNKKDVGLRLANIALNRDYGIKNIAYKSPMLKSYKIHNSSIICEFNNIGTGLKIKGGNVTECSVAGEDKKFYNATVKIIAPNKIQIESPKVQKPVAARYAWSNCPINGLLFNSYDLPMAPFRTDEWEESTYGVY